MDDLISRKAAIEAFLTELTKRERKNLLHTWSTVEVKYFVVEMLEQLPSAQPETHDKRTKTHSCDCISRQAAINEIKSLFLNVPYSEKNIAWSMALTKIRQLPSAQPELIEREAYIRGFEQGKTQGRLDTLSAQPERLTDDDFETIRIHLNAYKEKLCNQHRWGEANEYQRIIDRFMAFASAQPEIVRCKDCKYWMPHSQLGYDEDNETYHDYCKNLIPEDEYYAFYRCADDYCSFAERRTDEGD